MTTTKRKRARKKKLAASPPRRRRRRKSAPKRVPKAARRARGTRLQVEVTIPASLRLDGPELAQLSAAQRLELAGLGTRKRSAQRPGWAADDRTWRKAHRLVARHWGRYEHPYAAVALVYLRSGGDVGHERHTHASHAPGGRARPAARRRGGGDGGAGGGIALEVLRVDLDELGYDDSGRYYGPGEPLWRVVSSPDSPVWVDTVVRARTAAAARSQVAQQYGH